MKARLIISILFFIAFQIQASDYWELQLGTNYSTIRNYDTRVQPGFTVEIKKIWPKNEWFQLCLGASLCHSKGTLENVSRGWEDEKNIYVFYSDIDYNFNTISFPVGIQLKYSLTGKFLPFFELLPQIDIQISSHTKESLQAKKVLDKWDVEKFNFDTEIEYGNSAYVVNSGASLLLGTGVEIKNTSLCIQYKYPLTRIHTIGNFKIDQYQDIVFLSITQKL